MKILIGGDSWGCGEWGNHNGNYCVLHKGLAQYFRDDGYSVVNTSEGGSSNKESITRLKNTLDFKPDFIIWLQSDPMRDNRPYTNLHEYAPTYEKLIELHNQILESNYKKLDSFNKKIYILGGCSKINLDLIEKYKNLIPIIPSIPEFLFPDFKHPQTWISDWVIENLNNKLLASLLKNKNLQDELWDDPKYAYYFQPDGHHPNRYGILKVYEYIKNIIVN